MDSYVTELIHPDVLFNTESNDLPLFVIIREDIYNNDLKSLFFKLMIKPTRIALTPKYT